MVSASLSRPGLVINLIAALPPTAGQGVSQALEDAYALSLLLAHYLTSTTDISQAEAIKQSNEMYAAMRHERTEYILDYSNKIGNAKKDKGFILEWVVYGFMWMFGQSKL